VVNPTFILGPTLTAAPASSLQLVKAMLDGTMTVVRRQRFGIADVRDVADLHIRAMTTPSAKGERFLAVAGDFLSIQEIAKVLKARLGDAARRVPVRELPNWMVRLAALRDPALRTITPELGKKKNATGEKARRMLGWAPRSNGEALVATAESLVRLGLLKDGARQAG